MSLFELILLAIGLSMDAFAVSICKGLALRKARWRDAVIVGLWFGGFQALMPVIGYALAAAFERYITAVVHWSVFGLLLLIGANMIREGLSGDEEKSSGLFGAGAMLPLAVATSIDALAVGITFGLVRGVPIGVAATIIGVITFLISAVGLKIGNVFGTKYKSKAEIAGGVILILIGVKVLLEHLGILKF